MAVSYSHDEILFLPDEKTEVDAAALERAKADDHFSISYGGSDEKEELLAAGCCHICPRGSEHSIINTGDDDLVMLTVVVEQDRK